MYQQYVKHRLTANVLLFLIVLAGAWGIQQLRSQLFPDLEFPVIRANYQWQGADARTVRNDLVSPIEAALIGLDEVETVSSASLDQSVRLNISVAEGVEINDAILAAEEAINQLNLPADVEGGELNAWRFPEAVAYLMLYGDIDRYALTQQANEVVTQLENLGIKEVELTGGANYFVDIQVDLAALLDYGLTLEQLGNQIAAGFSANPAGAVTINEQTSSISLSVADWSLNALRQLSIRTSNGTQLWLRDVASIDDRLDMDSVLIHQGLPAVEIAISRLPGEDTLALAELINQWQADNQEGLQLSLKRYNELWLVVKAQLELLVQNGLLGIGLVLLALFLLLRIRIAVWVAAGIPVTLAMVVAAMGWWDISLNTMSLFGFIIALGIIVDDAIVVAEDAASLEQQGMAAKDAATVAARRMFPPVLASSLTTIAAFLPLVLIGGQFGNLLIDIPIIVSIAIAASLIECFLILPGHLAHHGRMRPASPTRKRIETAFNQFRDGPFDWLLGKALANRAVTLVLTLLVTGGAVFGIASGRVAVDPAPSIETAEITMNLRFVPGTTMQQALAAIADVEATADSLDPGGELIIHRYQRLDDQQVPSQATLFFNLTSDTDRALSNSEISDRLNATELPEYVEQASAGRGRGRGFGSSGELSFRLAGDNIDELIEAAEYAVSWLENDSRFSDISSSLDDSSTGFGLDIIQPGIDRANVASQLRTWLNTINLHEAAEGDRFELSIGEVSPQLLQALPINIDGQYFPLSALAKLDLSEQAERYFSRDGRLSVSIDASYSGENISDFYPELEASLLPLLKVRFDVDSEISGQNEEIQQFINDAVIALLVSMLLVYLILALIFESWLWPFAVMIAVPFGLTGAIYGHWFTGLEVTVVSIFGFIGLSGIVVNDSIILLTVFRRLLSEGMAHQQALHEAALSRLRPVILTSITTMAGLTPLLFETSFDVALLKPVAAGIVFGLALATLLILIVVPTILSLLPNRRLQQKNV
ncbi:efflux RND transporter permease subunit [Salinibius halmophilus]|uniref:efflux RND transporter permease subunit n=1 Tax=Salinibius halmophilus TaxID=1853216 RepID=UPI000E675744|nr:efflux RND transporter permease subunit [Salinibius halmophilus]